MNIVPFALSTIKSPQSVIDMRNRLDIFSAGKEIADFGSRKITKIDVLSCINGIISFRINSICRYRG